MFKCLLIKAPSIGSGANDIVVPEGFQLGREGGNGLKTKLL